MSSLHVVSEDEMKQWESEIKARASAQGLRRLTLTESRLLRAIDEIRRLTEQAAVSDQS